MGIHVSLTICRRVGPATHWSLSKVSSESELARQKDRERQQERGERKRERERGKWGGACPLEAERDEQRERDTRFQEHCRANSAPRRQPKPDSGLN